MSCRRSGIINSTPSHPPSSAKKKTLQYCSGNPRKMSAGKVKITPPAMDSPAEPVVCTMLFSRTVALPNARRMLMDSTAIGIDAETVSPARKPTYTVIAPKKSPAKIPRTIARVVNSGIIFSEGMYGRNSPGGATELHGFEGAAPFASTSFVTAGGWLPIPTPSRNQSLRTVTSLAKPSKPAICAHRCKPTAFSDRLIQCEILNHRVQLRLRLRALRLQIGILLLQPVELILLTGELLRVTLGEGAFFCGSFQCF